MTFAQCMFTRDVLAFRTFDDEYGYNMYMCTYIIPIFYIHTKSVQFISRIMWFCLFSFDIYFILLEKFIFRSSQLINIAPATTTTRPRIKCFFFRSLLRRRRQYVVWKFSELSRFVRSVASSGMTTSSNSLQIVFNLFSHDYFDEIMCVASKLKQNSTN